MEQRLIQKARRRDRAASWFITGGGLLIIVTIIGIFFLIASVAVPLFQGAGAERRAVSDLPGGIEVSSVLAVGSGEYLENLFLLSAAGEFIFTEPRGGQPHKSIRLEPPGGGPAHLLSSELSGKLRYSLTWASGWVSLEEVSVVPRFDRGGRRSLAISVERVTALPPPAGEVPLLALARFDEEAGATAAFLLPGNRLAISQQRAGEGFMEEAEPEILHYPLDSPLPGRVTAIVLNGSGTALYAGTGNGHLLRWDLSEPGEPVLVESQAAFADGRAVTALAMALGEITLLVGDGGGGVSAWFPVRPAQGGAKVLRNIHHLQGHGAAIRQLLPSRRGRSVVSLAEDGSVAFNHITNERHLLSLDAPSPLVRIGLSTRFNGMVGLEASGELGLWDINIPHPEASWSSYFGKIWYEGYQEPAYVWQSSAGSDDYEPKLSLLPLIFGTLKATFFGMLFATPLAILGAIYTSHLMNAGLRNFVKPAIEIMGAVPSVVIGFLAALWLAPILNTSLPGIFMMLGLLPLVIVATLFLWERIAARLPVRHFGRGFELLILIPTICLAIYASLGLGEVLEQHLFAGNFPVWLYRHLGVVADQRNSIVIAFALGFAVVPIIFTIADDALVNVPPNLTAASLALGASRWQTVWRVVLPSASPGIFAALMIGLGRAVGETMIVLMATGNTPIMDWSVFNGMRTLAANIAVEIPEAPVSSTLYRTLFLSGLLLFMVTFLINSAAEAVRQRLRKKYGRF